MKRYAPEAGRRKIAKTARKRFFGEVKGR